MLLHTTLLTDNLDAAQPAGAGIRLASGPQEGGLGELFAGLLRQYAGSAEALAEAERGGMADASEAVALEAESLNSLLGQLEEVLAALQYNEQADERQVQELLQVDTDELDEVLQTLVGLLERFVSPDESVQAAWPVQQEGMRGEAALSEQSDAALSGGLRHDPLLSVDGQPSRKQDEADAANIAARVAASDEEGEVMTVAERLKAVLTLVRAIQADREGEARQLSRPAGTPPVQADPMARAAVAGDTEVALAPDGVESEEQAPASPVQGERRVPESMRPVTDARAQLPLPQRLKQLVERFTIILSQGQGSAPEVRASQPMVVEAQSVEQAQPLSLSGPQSAAPLAQMLAPHAGWASREFAPQHPVIRQESGLIQSQPISGTETDGEASLSGEGRQSQAQAPVADRVAGAARGEMSLQLPLRHPQWGEQLAQRVMILAQNNQQLAQIRLHPAHLGPIQVKLKMEADSGVQVSLHAHHALTREAIEQALPRLRELFQQQGLALGDVTVQPDERGHAQAFADARREQGQGRGWATPDAEPASGDESPAGLSGRVRVLQGLVDQFV